MAEQGGGADAAAATMLDPGSASAGGVGEGEQDAAEDWPFDGEVDLEVDLGELLEDVPFASEGKLDLEEDLGKLLEDGLFEEAPGDAELDGHFDVEEPAPHTAAPGRQTKDAPLSPDAGAGTAKEQQRGSPDSAGAGFDGLFSDTEEPEPHVAPPGGGRHLGGAEPAPTLAAPAAPAPEPAAPVAPEPQGADVFAAASAAFQPPSREPSPAKPEQESAIPPPPPPFVAASGPSSGGAAAEGESFADESGYMQGPDGERLLKWKVDYANRGGAGRAMCRDLDCLERHEQAGVRTIEKGALRIGRRVLMEKNDDRPQLMVFWHHARCMFNTFIRSKKQTRVIQSPNDLEGFSAISPEDQDLLRRYIDGSEDVRRSRGGGGRGGAANAQKPLDTPEKRGAEKEPKGAPALKRQNQGFRVDVRGRKGERVWTYCRVRAPDVGGAPALGGGSMRSPKPELGLIIAEDEGGGSFVVQFESEQHEKERMESFGNRKFKSRKSWLRYPRLFEGKKQRIPRKWIQWDRPPPRLCSCNTQEWGHICEHGNSCNRGTTKKVWGVCQ